MKKLAMKKKEFDFLLMRVVDEAATKLDWKSLYGLWGMKRVQKWSLMNVIESGNEKQIAWSAEYNGANVPMTKKVVLVLNMMCSEYIGLAGNKLGNSQVFRKV